MSDIAFASSLSMATYFKLKLQLRLATEIDLSTYIEFHCAFHRNSAFQTFAEY